MTNRPALISISGGIAVGKTTLARALGDIIHNAQCFIEQPELNPYLADFYADMKRWAFHSRIAMLAMFASRYKQFAPNVLTIVQDRCLNELITFARLQFEAGNLDERDFSIYEHLFEGYLYLAPPLTAVLYLTCSPDIAMERIALRDRAFERNVTPGYLTRVEEQYERWLATLPPNTRVLRYKTDVGLQPEAIASDLHPLLDPA